ncbi:hypothetical protein CCACVL1_26386 [Corchorus capsularis]|uniref:Protein kinase domain-containing protein n=1 Tax=Corchorus capsularis TaxID=210143 RepID=A0A1R3GEY3_COCAP|nr:hypothetical protein CCACVL1_26386 [Corchorus capsularis]
MAVKSCDSTISASLKSEKQVLDQIGFCPQIIRCFGDGYSVEDGETLYNLFLENGDEEQRKMEIRGTPLNLAPESVNNNEYDSPVDIWALGCAIVEMFTGKPAWNFKPGSNVAALLIKIGVSDESPVIPTELSDEGKDFLGKCFVKDPNNRWTADMLLDHPFMFGSNYDDEEEEEASTSPDCSFEDASVSPRCPFDFPDWVSTQSTISSQSTFQENSRLVSPFSSYISSGLDRIRQLDCDQAPNWSFSGSWMTVR